MPTYPHYNNIFNKKNVEYSLTEKNNRLPNPSVVLRVNQILFNPINDAFNQLLNNDLYNQALLKQYMEEGASAGPTYAKSIEEVLRSADEDKKYVVSGENGLSIVHKENVPVAETLSGRFLDGKSVNKVSYIDDSFVALTEDGIYFSSNKSDWIEKTSTSDIDFVDICHNYNCFIARDSELSCFDWIAVGNSSNGIMLFGHDATVSEKDVWIDFSSNERLSGFNIPGKKAVGIYSFEKDPKLYICAKNDGMWSTHGRSGENYSRENGTKNWTVNDFIALDSENEHEKYLLATNYGVKQSRLVEGFSGVEMFHRFQNNVYPFDVAFGDNGETYVASSIGVLVLRGGSEQTWIPELNGIACFCFLKNYYGLFVGTSAGIFRIDGTSALETNTELLEVSQLVEASNCVFALVSDKLFYFENSSFSGKAKEVAGLSGKKVRQIKVYGGTAYAVTDSGIYSIEIDEAHEEIEFANFASNLSGKKIRFSKNIESEELVIQDENNAVYRVIGLTNASEVQTIDSPQEDGNRLKIVDVLKKDNDYYFLAENWKIYKNGTAIVEDVQVSSMSLANDYSEDGLLYLSKEDGSVWFYSFSNSRRRKVSIEGHSFSDLGRTSIGQSLVLSSNAVYRFGLENQYGLEREDGNPPSNVDETQRDTYFRRNGQLYSDVSYLTANSDSLNVEVASEVFQKIGSTLSANVYIPFSIEPTNGFNIRSVDFIGYTTDVSSPTGGPLVAVSMENGTSKKIGIYSLNAVLTGENETLGISSWVSLVSEKTDLSTAAFANFYRFSDADLSVGLNFVLDGNAVRYVEAERKFSQLENFSQIPSMNGAIPFGNEKTLVLGSNGLYLYDAKNNSFPNVLLADSNVKSVYRDGESYCFCVGNEVLTADEATIENSDDSVLNNIVPPGAFEELSSISKEISQYAKLALQVEEIPTVSSLEEILSGLEPIAVNGIEEGEITSLYYSESKVCLGSRIGKVYELTGNGSNYGVQEIPGAVPKDLNSIVEENLANSILVDSPLRIKSRIEDNSSVFSQKNKFSSIAVEEAIGFSSEGSEQRFFLCSDTMDSFYGNSYSESLKISRRNNRLRLSASENVESYVFVLSSIVSCSVYEYVYDEEISAYERIVSSLVSSEVSSYEINTSETTINLSLLSVFIDSKMVPETDFIVEMLGEINTVVVDPESQDPYLVLATLSSSYDVEASIRDNVAVPNIYQTLDGKYLDPVYISSEIEEIVDFSKLAGFVVEDSSNQNSFFFDGLSCYKFSSIRHASTQKDINFVLIEKDTEEHDLGKCFYFSDSYENNFLRELDVSGLKIKAIDGFDGKLFLGTEDDSSNGGLYCLDSSSFPNPTRDSRINSTNVVSLVHSDFELFAYSSGTQEKIYVIDSVSSVLASLDVDPLAFLFVGQSEDIYCSSEDGKKLYKIAKNGSVYGLETIESNTPAVIRYYIDNVEVLNSSVFLASEEAFFKQNMFDFANDGYSNALTADSPFVDAKTVFSGNSTFVIVAHGKEIDYLEVNSNSPSRFSTHSILSDSFSQSLDCIKKIGFTKNNCLVFIDSQDNLYVSKNSILDEDGNISRIGSNAFSRSDFIVSPNAASNVQDPVFTDLVRNIRVAQPLLIDMATGDHYVLDLRSIYSELENPVILPSEGSYRFVYDYSNRNLYAISLETSSKIYKHSVSDDSWSLVSSGGKQYDPYKFAIENENSFWTIKKSRRFENRLLPRNILNGSIEPYDMDSTPTGLFVFGGEVYYYSEETPGIYRKTLVESYHVDPTAVFGSENKDVYLLSFIDSRYVYNYLSSYEEIDPELPGDHPIDMVASIIESEDPTLSVLNDYSSSVPMVAIEKIGNRVFVSDGEDGYADNVVLGIQEKIEFEQLANANGSDSILLFLKKVGNHFFFGYGNSLGYFDGFSKISKFSEPSKKYSILANNFRSGTNRIEAIENGKDFLVGSNFGLKYVRDNFITKSFYSKKDKNDSINGNVADIEKVNSADNEHYYVVAKENQLYEVTDLNASKFSKLLEFQEDEIIQDVFSIQKNEYLIGTSKGLYLTSNSYRAINDLGRFTIDTVYGILNEELAKIISKHVEEDHRPDSFVSRLNRKADAKLSFLDSSDRHSDILKSDVANGVKIVENDIIRSIERGGESESSESYVKVAVKNWATDAIETDSFYSDSGFVSKFTDPTSGKTFDISTVPYIVKNWMSGLKEIYIYVPTTATYYINNPQGMSNSLYTYNAIERKNIPGVSNVNILESCCTKLRVYLYNSHFHIKTILAAQCAGNSLPLKIYKDDVNADDSWKGFFDTVVQPSVLRTLPSTPDGSVNNVRACIDETDRIFLDFSVYGTDAQAIRIIAET